MRTGTSNNYIKWSKSWGGVRKCFESKPTLLVGGFKYNLNELPATGNVLPAGTPVYCDETERTIAPMYLFQVKSVDASGKTVTVEKNMEGTRAKVGMNLIPLGIDLSAAASANLKVTAIDSSAKDVDVLTLSATTGIESSTVLVESNEEMKPKVVPNALTPYDVSVDEDSFACDGDGAWAVYDTPVLVRRMCVLPEVVRAALKDAGCVFRFSNRK